MRGGTSKGVFFRLQDLPEAAQRARRGARRAAAARDRQPRPVRQADRRHGRRHVQHQQDGDPREQPRKPDHDVDYLFGQVAIDKPFVDWSGNCGNLSAAVGPFAIASGLVDPARVPHDGVAMVRIWQANIGKTIIAHVPMTDGEVQETGDFELDGVTFPAAEVQLEFMDPAAEEEGGGGAMFPTGNLVDELDVPGVGVLHATHDQCRHPDHLRRRRRHRLHGHRAAGRDQWRPARAGRVRDHPRARRAAHGPDRARR